MKNKSVSIIIINYNDLQRVERAINSAITQTWKDVEVIVVDDGSKPEVREIYKKYDDQIKLVQLERDDLTKRTPSRARNAGYKIAKGKYIAFLDSDNYYKNNMVESCMKTDNDVYFFNWEIIGLENYKIEVQKVWKFDEPLMKNYLTYQHLDHQCILFSKEILKKLTDKNGNLYDERLPRSQDCDLIIRAMQLSASWKHVEKTLFFFEKHEKDQTKSYASIHGKTLWTLKNNINPLWLLGLVKNDFGIFTAIYKGCVDFLTNDEWKKERENGEFKKTIQHFYNIIDGEKKEKI